MHPELVLCEKPILDLGCGFNRLDGADVRVDYVHLIGGRFRSVCNVYADAHKLPFLNQVFGGINTDNVFEHFQHPQNVIFECRRILKVGGFIRVVVPLHLDVLGLDVEKESLEICKNPKLFHHYVDSNWVSWRFEKPILDIHTTNCDENTVLNWFEGWDLETHRIEKVGALLVSLSVFRRN